MERRLDRGWYGFKSAAPNEVGEPLFSSQTIPLRIHRQQCQMRIMYREPCLQRVECSIALTDPGKNQRGGVWRRVAFMRQRFQSLQDRECFIPAPHFRQDVPTKRKKLAVIASESRGSSQCIKRRFVFAQLLASLRDHVMANPEVGLNNGGLARKFDGRRKISQHERDLRVRLVGSRFSEV